MSEELDTGDDAGTGRLWSLDDLATRPAVIDHGATADGTAVAVAALAFSPDGRQLATGTGVLPIEHGLAKVFDPPTSRRRRRLRKTSPPTITVSQRPPPSS